MKLNLFSQFKTHKKGEINGYALKQTKYEYKIYLLETAFKYDVK